MEHPPAERRVEAGDDAEPPHFDALDDPEEVVRTEDTFGRVYTTVLQLDEPATVAEVADRSRTDPGTARKYLRRFADIGFVSRTSDTPAQYAVDRDFLRLRRAKRLAKRHSPAELAERLDDVRKTIDTFVDRYDARAPDAVEVTAAAAERERSVTDVWEDLGDWATARERYALYDLALWYSRKRRGADDASIYYRLLAAGPGTDADGGTERRPSEAEAESDPGGRSPDD